MLYDYICPNGHEEIIHLSLNEVGKKKVYCKCGLEMSRSWKNAPSIKISYLPPDFGKSMNAEKEIQVAERIEEDGHKKGSFRL
jgi:hypothetical protein